MLEAHLALLQLHLRCIWLVTDFGITFQQFEDQIHIRQRVLDLAIDDAEKIERDKKLQQEGVDQHQITDAHLAFHHSVGGKKHDAHDTDADDRSLSKIEKRHGGLAHHRLAFPLFKRAVKTVQLQLLVTEVLDRFVIDQAVQRLTIGLGFQPIHLQAIIHAPLGYRKGKGHIDGYRTEGHQGKHDVVLGQQNDRHKRELHQHRQDAEHHIVENGADATGPTLQIPADGAGLAFQMKTQ